MSFEPRSLSVLAHSAGFTLWLYRAQRSAEAREPGFFASCRLLAPGDMVVVSAQDGGQVLCVAAGAAVSPISG